jgi:hypothetical protein
MAQAVRRSACDMGIAGPDKARAASSSPGLTDLEAQRVPTHRRLKANSTSVESSCGRPGLVAALVELQASGLADQLGPTQPDTIRAPAESRSRDRMS